MARALLRLFALASVTAADDIMIATFDGAKGTTLTWKEMNDPVMGGKSTGTFTIDSASKVGVFDGKCAIVPSLKAPGFITAGATGSFPDISHCQNLVLNVNSANSFAGFRVSFGSEHYPPFYKHFFARGFKSDFQPPTGKFGDVVLPLKGFTDHWDDATGKAITTCADDSKACPTQKRLQNLETVQIWAEGIEGDVHLQIRSIRASGCTTGHVFPVVAAASISNEIPVVTFDGAKGTTYKFTELNDPVMGGKSTGTWSLNTAGGFGIFDGEVVNVPSLKAPGFIEAHADGKFADLSAAAAGDLVLRVRSSPEYKGWKVSLASGAHSASYSCAAGGGLPFSRGCYKAPFSLPAASSAGDFAEVRVPFASFTDRWSSYTGDPVKTCKEDASTCLTAEKLKSVQRVELMAEGVAGKVHLEVKSISAAPAESQTVVIV